MEPQPETATATVRVCGQDIQTTAEELKLTGLQVKDPADFTALSQVVNLRTITLSKMTFADAEWDGSLANIKACRHLTHLNLTACSLGPKHTADLAGIFSSGGCNITTLCLAKNGLTGATFYSSGNVRAGVDSNLDGIITLLTALKKSQVICIDFSGCGLGPNSMGHLAEYLRDAIAALALMNISFNKIGAEGGTVELRGNNGLVDRVLPTDKENELRIITRHNTRHYHTTRITHCTPHRTSLGALVGGVSGVSRV